MFYKAKLIAEDGVKPKSKSHRIWFFWLVLLLLLVFAAVAAIYLLVTSQSEMVVTKLLDDDSELRSLADEFARTVTRQDWKGNTELFVAGSTIDFHRAFTFLTDYPPLSTNNDLLVDTAPVGSWGQQLAVFAGGTTSNHLIINNCNISYGTNTANLDCIAVYTYSLAYSTSFFTNNFPTQLVFFQPRFDAIKTSQNGWKFTHALALINATNTLLSSIETGVAPPGAIITKKDIIPWSPSYSKTHRVKHKRDPLVVWNTLQDQINSLVAKNQIDTARAICRTEQYITLAASFDPYQNDTSYMCNTIMRIPVTLDSPMTCGPNGSINASCLSGDLDAIQTINSITPLPATDDFTITGGVGIAVQGNMHGITIHNVGIAVLNLIAPFPFYFTKVLSFISPSITLNLNNTAAHTVWAGPLSGPDAPPTFRLLEESDLPIIFLNGTKISGILGLSNGGTNNAGPYVGGRIIISNAGGTQLVESPALSDGFFLVSDGMGGFVPGTIAPGAGINITFSSGIFTITSLDPITVVQVDLAVPTDIFAVTSSPVIDNGTLTFVVIPQAAKTFWAGPVSGSPANPSFRLLEESDLPIIFLNGTKISGILGVSNGGTNNDGSTWVGQRVMMSDTGGTSITEGTITGENGVSITYGPGPSMVISGTGGVCTNSSIDQSCLEISGLSCPGGALGASCIPSTLTLAALTVTGPASLGTSTTCAAPLSAPCYDISSQSCPGGYLNTNCINPNLVLNSITVDSITANSITLLNGTITVTGVSEFEAVNASTLYASNIVLSGPMTCDPEDTISQSCYDISGITCTAPISSNCFPINLTVADLSVTNNLEVNNVACLGSPLGNDCIPSRVRTINGISPSAAPILNFQISSGTGISITPGTNGITIDNTGVTSVGLSLPSSILSVTVSTVTTTGTLTAILQTQTANTFWAGPLMGSPATPTFRAIEFLDLPTNSTTNSVYFVDGSGNLGVSPLSISLAVPSAEFSILGSPITDPSGGFIIGKQNQAARSFWAGPTSGGPAQPSFRSIGFGDLLPLGLTNGQVLTGVTSGAPVGKTLVAGTNMMITEMAGSFVFDANSVDAIQNISMTVPSWLSVTPATLYSSGTFDITANTQAANTFLAGPTSGGAAVPSFRTMGYSDLPALADGQIYIGSTGMAPVPTQLTAGSLITITPGPGTSTVSTSALGMVTLNMPMSLYSVMSSSGMNAQTLTVSLATQTANTVWAGPSTGIPAAPTFRSLVDLDIPNLDASKITTGILPIARGGTNSGTALTNGKIMVSSGGSIVEGTSSSTPSFTSETLTATTNQLTLGTTNTATISATAPSAPRTYTIADPGANANFVMDTASALTITNAGSVGQILALTGATTAAWQTVVGTGSVTSVGLALPVSVFSISGSPVTTTGTLTGSFVTQTANTFFAGPTTGGAATPTFRTLVTADLPVAILLSYLEAQTSASILGFGTTSYTVVTSMTLTPPAGTHWCSFSTTVFPSTGSAIFDIALHLNGGIISHSRRKIGGAGSNFIVHTLAVVTTPGGQAVDVRWQRSSMTGTAEMYERSLYCLRIG